MEDELNQEEKCDSLHPYQLTGVAPFCLSVSFLLSCQLCLLCSLMSATFCCESDLELWQTVVARDVLSAAAIQPLRIHPWSFASGRLQDLNHEMHGLQQTYLIIINSSCPKCSSWQTAPDHTGIHTPGDKIHSLIHSLLCCQPPHCKHLCTI